MSDAYSGRPTGRLAVVDALTPDDGLSISVGSKETRLADVNVDIDVSVSPDVLADARQLPFPANTFDTVLFTAVLELIPATDERRTLEELRRVLKPGGHLVLTLLNDVRLYELLDVGRFYSGVRSFTPAKVERLLDETGYEIEQMFTSGNIMAPITYTWYCLVSYPLSKVWPGRDWNYAPRALKRRSDRAYEEYDVDDRRMDGRMIFVRAVNR